LKRAALLLLIAGAPLLLVLFPRLRRAAARKGRLVLLLWVGAILLTGFATGVWSGRAEVMSEGQWILAAAAVVLVLVAFGSVVRDALKGRSTRG
jgi:cytochrome b561